MPLEVDNNSEINRESPIAIISGYGSLPAEIAAGAMACGRQPFMVGIEGEADCSIEEFDHRYMNLGQFGSLLKLLKKKGISQIVMAGGVHARPEVFKMKLDWGAISSIPRAMALLLGGDDTLLSGLIKLFEDHKIQVVGAHQVVPKLLSTSGKIAGRKPGRKDLVNIELAAAACIALGELDIGQAAIAEGGRVIAIEGVEGTDGLLQRVVDLRQSGRLPAVGKNGVLVKLMKTSQDHRVDMPAIGPNTILEAKRAGLFGIAIDAGKSLILQRDETLELAVKNKIYIFGYECNSLPAGCSS
ncbi:MAG: UDP-2,3-diacylglucosamine diphosphatase LpxI [Hyphomicrobiales bacterium]|nr:UDP-2,3-diacylglucosamine diphosphatase LpxI [Hyphomicrobiales bacterium]